MVLIACEAWNEGRDFPRFYLGLGDSLARLQKDSAISIWPRIIPLFQEYQRTFIW